MHISVYVDVGDDKGRSEVYFIPIENVVELNPNNSVIFYTGCKFLQGTLTRETLAEIKKRTLPTQSGFMAKLSSDGNIYY